uniref:Uncharacterized protein n=1 Tax=Arundo donax TaxID=35708 RepID=A0A0A8XYZ5_ARUDO
MPFPFESR